MLFSSFLLIQIVKLPSEKFSELYLLGPQQLAQDLPFNIMPGKNYTIYLGVGNHLDSTAYYCCYIKIRNQTEPSANETISSMLTPVYTYRTILKNGAACAVPLTFSFSDVSFSSDQSILETLTINNVQVNLTKKALFDKDNNGYYYQMFVELWAFNPESRISEYQQRLVYFWLNATSSA